MDVALCLAGTVHCGEMPGTARGMLVAGALGRVTPRGLLPSASPGARAVHPPWAGLRPCGPGAAATGGGVSVPVGGPGRRRPVGEGGARVAGGRALASWRVGGGGGTAGEETWNPKRGGGEPTRERRAGDGGRGTPADDVEFNASDGRETGDDGGRRGTQAVETRRAPLASWLGCGRKEHAA